MKKDCDSCDVEAYGVDIHLCYSCIDVMREDSLHLAKRIFRYKPQQKEAENVD